MLVMPWVTHVGVVIWTVDEWSERVTSLTCLVVGASYCLGLSSLALILYKYSHDSQWLHSKKAELKHWPFMTLTENSHSVTSFILSWSKKITKPA